jgi:two-component system, OmpR family, sensor histidine kinase VicK
MPSPLVKERASRHGIALELDLDLRLGELVGDERKVKQVLLNRLSNAVKFTPERGRISLKAGRPDGAVIWAAVWRDSVGSPGEGAGRTRRKRPKGRPLEGGPSPSGGCRVTRNTR